MSQKILALLAIIPVLFLAACGSDNTVDDADATSSTETGDELPFSGKDIGYITFFYDADDDLRGLDVDLIEWYTGDDAARAAKQADPDCPGDCMPPNGYFIQNTQKDPFTFDVANDVRVYLVPDEEVTYEEFLRSVRGSNGRTNEHYRLSPFWITHEDGVITEIRGQYIP